VSSRNSRLTADAGVVKEVIVEQNSPSSLAGTAIPAGLFFCQRTALARHRNGTDIGESFRYVLAVFVTLRPQNRLLFSQRYL
jgi:hypothetical protein